MHQAAGGTAAGAEQRSAADADALVIQVLQRHADTLLRVARRHSLCDEDAADAYQRGLEIFLGHARRLEADTAHRWLFRVVRNEAVTVREQRQRFMGPVPVEPDEIEAVTVPSPEEQALARERLAQAAEALAALKDDELQALWMQASGHSYSEIAAGAGWTRTKVNRALVEGRRRLFAERAAIDSGRACARWEPVLDALAGGRADARQLQEMRLHLRHCAVCQRAVRGIQRSGSRAAALLPLGLLAGDAGDLPGLVLGAGGGGAAGGAPAAAAGWVARVHEVIAGHLQERAALSLMKVQAAADVMTAGKVAAVAASAAALAGGGAVAVHERAPGLHQQGLAARGAAVRPGGASGAAARTAGGGRSAGSRSGAGGPAVPVAPSGPGAALPAGAAGGWRLSASAGTAGVAVGVGGAAGAAGAGGAGGGGARTLRADMGSRRDAGRNAGGRAAPGADGEWPASGRPAPTTADRELRRTDPATSAPAAEPGASGRPGAASPASLGPAPAATPEGPSGSAQLARPRPAPPARSGGEFPAAGGRTGGRSEFTP